jgi:hypothetical protein
MSLILDGMRRQVLTYTTSLKNGSTCSRISLYPYAYSQTFHTIRKLFQAAGVKKTDLKDGATAKLIVDTVSATAATLRTLPVPPGVSPLPDLGYLDAKDEAALVGAITSILSARYTLPLLSCATLTLSLLFRRTLAPPEDEDDEECNSFNSEDEWSDGDVGDHSKPSVTSQKTSTQSTDSNSSVDTRKKHTGEGEQASKRSSQKDTNNNKDKKEEKPRRKTDPRSAPTTRRSEKGSSSSSHKDSNNKDKKEEKPREGGSKERRQRDAKESSSSPAVASPRRNSTGSARRKEASTVTPSSASSASSTPTQPKREGGTLRRHAKENGG